MSEEIKERLSKTEYDKVGEMLLELIAECPFIPKDAKVKYNSKDVGKCVYIITTGGGLKKKYISGSFTAEIGLQIAYQSFPQGNGQMINAQALVDNIANWLEDVENLPKLTGNRTITKITANNSFPNVEEVEGDKATVFAVNVVMEYYKKGA